MSATSISQVHAREILDSRGNPTVEVDVHLEGGGFGRAAVPSGASTGEHEAWELRDGDKKRYGGKGVTQSRAPRESRRSRRSWSASTRSSRRSSMQQIIELDGTPNKKKLGANALLGVSLAVAHAAADSERLPLFRYLGGSEAKVLPVPMMNILNGGAHSDAPIDFQEFMIMPKGAPTFPEALRYGAEVFHALKKVLHDRGLSTAIGDEGGFAPNLKSVEDALESIAAAVEKAGYKLGEQIFIALDPASSEFYDKEQDAYVFKKSDGSKRTAAELVDYYASLCAALPDHLDRGRLRGERLGWLEEIDRSNRRQGAAGRRRSFRDQRRFSAQRHRAGSGQFHSRKGEPDRHADRNLRRRSIWRNRMITPSVISHRSGETEDTTIADIAVATNAGQIKTGSLCRTDRVAKYNQLLRIAEELGDKAVYGGKMR